MSYDNTNTFVLFKNERKQTDKHPDYTGTIELEGGRKMRLAAWIMEGKKGKFMSGRLSEFMDMQSNQPQADAFNDASGNGFDDADIPF